MIGIDLEHYWCSYHEAVEIFRMSGNTLRVLASRGELRQLKRKPKNKRKAPFVYYNVADLVEYKEHSKSCEGFDLNDIEYSVFADREKYVDALTMGEYSEITGLSKGTIQNHLYKLIRLNVLTWDDIHVPGTNAVYINGKTRYALDNFNGFMKSIGKKVNASHPRPDYGEKPIYKTKCASCMYYSKNTWSCDYILIEGHSRGCDLGDACTKYKRGRKKREKVGLKLKGSL